MNLFLLAQAATPDAGKSADEIRNQALSQIKQLQFTELSSEQWIYLAEYYGSRAALVLVLMVFAWTLSGWLSVVVGKALRKVRFDETLTKFLSKLVRWGILLLVGLSCLSYFGVETTSFAAVIGATGLAVGLAFQGTLSNFAAGAMLLIFRPYKVGDAVNVAGILGSVNEIALFTTEIDTFDGRRIIIPNSSIYGTVIENITYHPRRRVDVPVGASYDADIDETRRVLELAISRVEQGLKDPEPMVLLNSLGGSSVDWEVRLWALKEEFLDVKQALIRAIKMELDAAEIGIPYPQMDVHLQQSPDKAA